MGMYSSESVDMINFLRFLTGNTCRARAGKTEKELDERPTGVRNLLDVF